MDPETLRVDHVEGDRFAIKVRGHSLDVDQPTIAGGSDLAPTPTELLVASLASCVAFYGRRFLRRHHLSEKISVEARWQMEPGPTRVGRIALNVKADGLPSALRPRFTSVVHHCTVHNTLMQRPMVTIDVADADTALDEVV